MKCRKIFRDSFWIVFLTGLLLVGGTSFKLRANPQTVAADNGLEITICLERHVANPRSPRFRIELRNVGERDLILNLGVMLANGKNQYPNAIALNLTDIQGKSRQLDLREPYHIAGRADPLVLPVPVGATFSVPVDLDKYWAASSGDFDYKLTPGRYSVEAQFRGDGVSRQAANIDAKGILLMPYWTGTVTSNQLQFEISSQ